MPTEGCESFVILWGHFWAQRTPYNSRVPCALHSLKWPQALCKFLLGKSWQPKLSGASVLTTFPSEEQGQSLFLRREGGQQLLLPSPLPLTSLLLTSHQHLRAHPPLLDIVLSSPPSSTPAKLHVLSEARRCGPNYLVISRRSAIRVLTLENQKLPPPHPRQFFGESPFFPDTIKMPEWGWWERSRQQEPPEGYRGASRFICSKYHSAVSSSAFKAWAKATVHSASSFTIITPPCSFVSEEFQFQMTWSRPGCRQNPKGSPIPKKWRISHLKSGFHLRVTCDSLGEIQQMDSQTAQSV